MKHDYYLNTKSIYAINKYIKGKELSFEGKIFKLESGRFYRIGKIRLNVPCIGMNGKEYILPLCYNLEKLTTKKGK